MSKKIMQCKSAPEIELSIDGGESILLRFDVQMFSNLQEDTKGGLKSFLKQSTADMAVMIIYAAGKDNNNDFTREKARALTSAMDFASVQEIIETFNESAGINTEDPAQKKMIAEILKSI